MKPSKHTVGNNGRRSGLLYILTTLIFCVTAATVAWFLSSGVPRALRDIDPPIVPVTTPATQVAATYSMNATLTVVFTPVLPLIVPEQSGTVTSLGFGPGDTLNDGTFLYSVNDRPVTAYVGDGVFYRDLKQGDLGDDVTQAQRPVESPRPYRNHCSASCKPNHYPSKA